MAAVTGGPNAVRPFLPGGGEQKDVTELTIIGPPERVWAKERRQGDLL